MTINRFFSNIHFFSELQSTSQFLKIKYKSNPEIAFCSSYLQTSGYGKLGAKWCSSESDITFSVLLPFNVSTNNLIGLSQTVTLLIKDAISAVTRSGCEIKVKWPNDVYLNDAKLAGVLIEVLSSSENDSWLVIGVGINQVSKSIFTDYEIASLLVDDSAGLTSNIANKLYELSVIFNERTWNGYMSNWQESDLFKIDQPVKIINGKFTESGLYKGVDDSGNIVVVSETENISKKFISGTVSLRDGN